MNIAFRRFLSLASLLSTAVYAVEPPRELIRSLGGEDAARFAKLTEPIRARKERCGDWRKEWDAAESRLGLSGESPRPLTDSGRAELLALVERYPAAPETAYAAWRIYADHPKSFDRRGLPTLDWMPAYEAYPSCAVVGLWNGMKALIAAPGDLHDSIGKFLALLLGEDGQDGTATDFRIAIALLERAAGAKKIQLPAAARAELAGIRGAEGNLTKAFRIREGELFKALTKFDHFEGDDRDPFRIRTVAGANTYRGLGEETFAYAAKLHTGPYADFAAWRAKWLPKTPRTTGISLHGKGRRRRVAAFPSRSPSRSATNQ